MACALPRYGETYKPPGYYSGYNEAIITVGSVNGRPKSILGFFYLKGSSPERDKFNVNVREARLSFIREHGAEYEAEVPLLQFDPSNWETPFSLG